MDYANFSKKQLIDKITQIQKQVTELKETKAALKAAKAALRESEERAHKFFESAPDAYFLYDLKGKLIDGNQMAEDLTGYNRHELIGQSLLKMSLLSMDQIPKAAKLLTQNVREHSTGPDEFVLTRKDGSQVAVEIRSHPVKFKKKTIVLGIAHDISNRKKTEEALREQRDRAQKYLDISGHMFVALNRKGEVTLINRTGCEVLGYKEAEILGKNWFDYFLPKHLIESVKLVFDKLMKGKIKAVQYFDNSVLTRKGQERHIFWHNAILKDDKGVISGTLSSGLDITERKQNEEALQSSLDGIIQTVALTVEIRDPYTAGHQKNVADLAANIGKEMGLDRNLIEGIKMAGIIHDLGKIGVPAEILAKPTKLTEHEFDIIKAHPQIGFDILKDVKFPWPIAQIVHQHHERMNGSGYPQGLTGEKIILEARILCVADVVEAMFSHRPYRPALGIKVALDEIKQNRQTLYDPDVVDACLRLFLEKNYAIGEEK